jgi:hypothetical protein
MDLEGLSEDGADISLNEREIFMYASFQWHFFCLFAKPLLQLHIDMTSTVIRSRYK